MPDEVKEISCRWVFFSLQFLKSGKALDIFKKSFPGLEQSYGEKKRNEPNFIVWRVCWKLQIYLHYILLQFHQIRTNWMYGCCWVFFGGGGGRKDGNGGFSTECRRGSACMSGVCMQSMAMCSLACIYVTMPVSYKLCVWVL